MCLPCNFAIFGDANSRYRGKCLRKALWPLGSITSPFLATWIPIIADFCTRVIYSIGLTQLDCDNLVWFPTNYPCLLEMAIQSWHRACPWWNRGFPNYNPSQIPTFPSIALSPWSRYGRFNRGAILSRIREKRSRYIGSKSASTFHPMKTKYP